MAFNKKRHADKFSSIFLEESKLVTSIAASLYKKRFDNSLEFDDYKHYGFIGLLEAKQKYTSDQGASFDTYATYRIRGSILNGIVKSSEKMQLYAYNSRREKDKLHSLKSSRPTNRADLFDAFIELAGNLAIASLLDDMSESEVSVDVCSETYYRSQMSSDLLLGVEHLNGNEKLIVTYHYFGGLDFQEVADILELTKGRISQLHKLALNKLRMILENSSHYSAEI